MADSHSLSLSPDCSRPSDLRLYSSAARDAISPSGNGGLSSSARYKLLSPAKLPISRSSCISLPSGISPTSFLESPVLLSNMKAEPSPTTGSFMNPQLWHGGSPGFSLAANCSKNDTSQPFGSANSITNEMTSSTNESSLPSPVHQLAIVPAVVDSEDMNQGMALTSGLKASQSDHKDIGHSITAERSSDDGYNWRKYGQKLVKGCEFPRSYYKCTHPNCEVKKIFERSYEGKITEIVYKGSHDHPKPLPARRFTAGAIMSIQEQTDHVLSLASGEVKSAMYCLNSHYNDPNGTPQRSPRGTNDNCLEGSTQLSGINEEGDEDDPFLKRRKLDGMSIDVTQVVKPIREPRVVVQTVSEVDILDDGYRWRKYGQKVVRGNPNPRSYYKCTNAECPVRKHVERASHDPKAVITTYEGKHNHDVPVARNSSHDMAGPEPEPGVGPANSNPMWRVRPDGNDSISLNLGVGITSVFESRPNERQQVDPGPMLFQGNRAGSIFNVVQFSPMSTIYGVVNGGSYVSRENHVGALNHSSNQCPKNLEGVPLGP